MRERLCLLLAVVVIVFGAGPGTLHAQDGGTSRADVFVGVDPDTGEPTVYLVDALSGLSTVVAAPFGVGFTLVEDYVIYQKESRTRSSGAARTRPPSRGSPRPTGGRLHG